MTDWNSARFAGVNATFGAQTAFHLGPAFEQLELDLGEAALSDPVTIQSGCLFCKHSDTSQNRIFRRFGSMYARYDNFPASPGHVEIVPFRHVDSYFDLREREVSDLAVLSRRVKAYLARQFNPDGYTIGVNDGSAAGRTVPHLHLHIIPRWFGDVEDPRGGIRCVLPGLSPEAWTK